VTTHDVPNSVPDLYETGIQFLDALVSNADLKAQFELEDNMKAEGARRYWEAKMDAEVNGTQGDLVPQKDLIRENILRVADKVREFLDADKARLEAAAAAKSKFRRQSPVAKVLSQLTAPTVAYIGLKICFNGLEIDRATAPLAMAIGKAIEEEIIVGQFAETEAKLYAAIVKAFTSRSSVHHRRVLKAAIQRHRPDLLDANEAKDGTHTQVGLVVLEAIITATGLFESDVVREGKNTRDIIRMSEVTRSYIIKRHAIAQYFIPVYTPTIIPPRPWTSTRDGGYHGVLAGKHAVVKGKNRDKAYMAELRDTDMPLVYEGLNYLQNTAWCINKPIFELMDKLAFNSTLGDLPDVAKEEELPKLEYPDDRSLWTEEQVARFKEWKQRSAAIHKSNFKKESQFSTLNIVMRTATQYLNYDRFYFPWNLDYRGRAYPVARGLQPQGTDWQKALLQFAKGRPYSDEARYWLAFHGANCKGETDEGVKLDKSLYETRVMWVIQNDAAIKKCAADPLAHTDFWSEAESPWMFLAFCMEWTRCEKLRSAGLPAQTYLAPALDGSCNGLQHFSAVLRDEIGGKAVNLTANEEPQDIYTEVAKKLIAMLTEMAKEEPIGVIETEEDEGTKKFKLCDVSMARRWLASGKIGRNLCKQPVMTMPYGSNQNGIKGQMLKAIEKMNFNFPPLPWTDKPSDGFSECQFLSGCIWKAIGATVVKAREAMDWLQNAARIANKAGVAIEWTAPSGLPVKQFYEDRSMQRVQTQFLGKIYTPHIIDMRKEPSLSKHEQVNGISPNFVHSLDASAMLLTVVQLGRQGVDSFAMIHDSYGVPCDQTQLLWDDLRAVFVEIYQNHDVLTDFRDRLIASLPEKLKEEVKPLPAQGTLDLDQITKSDFFFA